MHNHPTLDAITYEIARETELGHEVACIRISSAGLEGSIVTVPKLSGSFGAAPSQSIAHALQAAAGRPVREVLVHPNDWERLVREIPPPDYETPEGGTAPNRINGVPVEHAP